MNITEIMTERVATVHMDDALEVVKNAFDNSSIHHLLVVRKEELVGIVSDRDLLLALSPYLGTAAEVNRDTQTLQVKVHQIMTRKLITLPDTASIKEAAGLLLEHQISCIPIVDDRRKILGIVSWRDILRVLPSVMHSE